jgi:N-acetylmuramoyl-L-alanine amidase
VLDMQSVGEYKVFPLVSPFRIIIDVSGAELPAAGDATSVAGIIAGKSAPGSGSELRPISKDVAKVPFTQQLGLTIKRVVIDAGHGGKDPGAIGHGKLLEKEVTLRIAKKLAAKIEKELKIEAVLTRDNDSFIHLEGRPGIAKAERGDLFISIHANSAASKSAYGIETYHLDFTADRGAIAVAARENATSERGVSEQESILRDLVLTSKRNDSIQLARAVQGSLVGNLSKKYDHVRDLGVKGAPFVVLIGANIPAILVEVGFVSNPREAKRLQSDKYLDSLTDSIVDGIDKYTNTLQVTTF